MGQGDIFDMHQGGRSEESSVSYRFAQSRVADVHVKGLKTAVSA